MEWFFWIAIVAIFFWGDICAGIAMLVRAFKGEDSK